MVHGEHDVGRSRAKALLSVLGCRRGQSCVVCGSQRRGAGTAARVARRHGQCQSKGSELHVRQIWRPSAARAHKVTSATRFYYPLLPTPSTPRRSDWPARTWRKTCWNSAMGGASSVMLSPLGPPPPIAPARVRVKRRRASASGAVSISEETCGEHLL